MRGASCATLTLRVGLMASGWCCVGRLAAQSMPVLPATVRTAHVLNVVHPDRDWGAALDGHDLDAMLAMYTPANIAAMRSAGLHPVTYRLRTELGIETWHWNPVGTWSDAAHQQGYWISSAQSDRPIDLSFGYRLPRRGRTIDDANNDGYSRVDDGDTTTFWKSNPYLDPRFTHDGEAAHPQWLTLDLGHAAAVGSVRVQWGNPYPTHFVVEYWDGDQSLPIDDNPEGKWRRFAGGEVNGWHGGGSVVDLPAHPLTRFVRVVMYASSHTADGGNGDPRDSLGFAVREMFVGAADDGGVFRDLVHHDTLSTRQSVVLVSSTDPWHRAVDRDDDTAQPGLDLVFRSGLTNHLPMLVPTGLLFDTPDNAAAELRFLRSRRYPVKGIELGEEPDGQRITPEDYGALYAQFSAALRAVDPGVVTGGPSMQTLLDDVLSLWPERSSPGQRSTWVGRFLDYLDAHHRRSEFHFFSFEWYPFDDVCDDAGANLAAAPGMLTRSLDRLTRAGLPDSIPRIMTEYGYSAHLSTAEVTLPGALFDVDAVANFFAHGGSTAYYFGYEPSYLAHEATCAHWGNLIMFLADSTGQVRYRMPRYWSSWLLTHAWADSAGGAHQLFAVDLADTLVSAWALHRPDRRWSMLLVNRDPLHAITVSPRLDTRGADRPLRGPVDIWQYSSAQYVFVEAGEAGHPVIDLPPAHQAARDAETITLPPASITIITGT